MAKKGCIPWNKGIPRTEKEKKSISESLPDRSGKNNSFFGKKHTEKTKQKMREKRLGGKSWNKGLTKESDERVERGASKIRGVPKSEEHTRKMKDNMPDMSGERNGMFGRNHSPKSKQQMRKRHVFHIKRFHYNSQLEGEICFRSSWELKFAKWLDSKNIPWLYEIQTFNLGDMSYTPDFYLPTSNLFVEVKGYMSSRNKEQINKFLDNYPEETLQILYKEDLIKLGINLDKIENES